MTDLLAAVRQLQELREKATPGPWVPSGELAVRRATETSPHIPWGRAITETFRVEDTDFIAAARNLVGPLIQDWLRLRRIEEAAREYVLGLEVDVAINEETNARFKRGETVTMAVSSEAPSDPTAALRAALAVPGEQE